MLERRDEETAGRKETTRSTAMPAPSPAPRLDNPQPATGTVLAFDFGEKFTGVAVGESSVGMAHPLGLITAESSAARMHEIAALVAEWKPGFLAKTFSYTFSNCRQFKK